MLTQAHPPLWPRGGTSPTGLPAGLATSQLRDGRGGTSSARGQGDPEQLGHLPAPQARGRQRPPSDHLWSHLASQEQLQLRSLSLLSVRWGGWWSLPAGTGRARPGAWPGVSWHGPTRVLQPRGQDGPGSWPRCGVHTTEMRRRHKSGSGSSPRSAVTATTGLSTALSACSGAATLGEPSLSKGKGKQAPGPHPGHLRARNIGKLWAKAEVAAGLLGHSPEGHALYLLLGSCQQCH